MDTKKKAAPVKPNSARPATKPNPSSSASGVRAVVVPGKPVRRVGNYKSSLGTRLGAAAIDGVTGFIPALVLILTVSPAVGIIVWLAYLLIKDGMPIPALEYRSIGKKIVGLHVEDDETGHEQIAPIQSLKRNATAFGGMLVLAVLWHFEQPIIGALIAAIPVIVEVVMIAKDENGRRLGDRLGGTRVMD